MQNIYFLSFVSIELKWHKYEKKFLFEGVELEKYYYYSENYILVKRFHLYDCTILKLEKIYFSENIIEFYVFSKCK